MSTGAATHAHADDQHAGDQHAGDQHAGDQHAGDQGASSSPLPVSVGGLATLTVLGVVVFATTVAVRRLDEVIGIVLLAAVTALLTLPIQRRLARLVGHAGSLVATAIGTLVVAIAVAAAALRDLGAQADALASAVNDRLDDLRPGSTAGRVVRSLRLEDAIAAWLDRVPRLVVVGDDSGAGIGRQLVTLTMIVILAAFLQSSGRAWVDWFATRWPRGDDATAADTTSPRVAVRELLHDVDRRGIGHVRRLVVVVAGAAALVATACAVAGLPGAVVVGLWAGAWFAVPTVGPAVGIAPVLGLALVDGRAVALVPGLIAVVVAVLTGLGRRAFVDRPTLRLGAAPMVVAIAVGVAVAGIPGSLVAVVVVAVAAAVASSSHRITRPAHWCVAPGDAIRLGGLVIPRGVRGAALVASVVSAAVLLWELVVRSGAAIVWILVGGFVAIALDRPVAWLERRGRVPRRSAVGVVVVMIGALLTLATLAGADDGARATASLTDRLPEVVRDLEESPVIGDWLRDHDAAVWVSERMTDLPQQISRVRPADWLPTVTARMLDLFWTALLAVALLADGPRVAHQLERLVPARRRRQHARLIGAIGVALGSYAAGAALVAAINAGVVFTIAIVLGIGLAPFLAVWAFVWNFVPQIGGFMGGAPLVMFALVAGPYQALFAGAAFVTYQFVENHLIQPSIIGAAIDVPPWGTLVAALAGGAAAGVVGAIVLTPLVGIVRVVRQELARDDFPGASVTVEAGGSGSPLPAGVAAT